MRREKMPVLIRQCLKALSFHIRTALLNKKGDPSILPSARSSSPTKWWGNPDEVMKALEEPCVCEPAANPKACFISSPSAELAA